MIISLVNLLDNLSKLKNITECITSNFTFQSLDKTFTFQRNPQCDHLTPTLSYGKIIKLLNLWTKIESYDVTIHFKPLFIGLYLKKLYFLFVGAGSLGADFLLWPLQGATLTVDKTTLFVYFTILL